MAAAAPHVMVSETIDGCPVLLPDAGTSSGFVEDGNIWHSSYRQHGCGWVLNAGNFPIAYLDREGRVETRSYCFDFTFDMLGDGNFARKIYVHEHGNQIFLDFETSPDFEGTAHAVISVDGLPQSIRPRARVYGTLCAYTGGAEVIGTFVIWPSGEVRIYAGPVGTLFVGGGCHYRRFQAQYDRRPIELL